MSALAEKTIESKPRRHLSARPTVRVTEELDSLVQQLRRQLWLRGICLSIGTVMVLLLVLVVLDAIVQPQSAIARFLLWIAGFTILAETIRRSLSRPLREHCSRLNLAWSLEQRHPQIEERLTSTVQLTAQHDAKSSAFVEAIATQAQSGMASCSEESLAGRSLRNAITVAVICVVVFVLGLLLAPERLIPSLANVLRPWHDRVLPRLTARVLPGHAEIAEGLDLEIRVAGLDEHSAVLEIVSDAATSNHNATHESHSMVVDSEKQEATFLLQGVEKSLSYRVRSGGLYSDTFRITVHPIPVITGLQATITFPDYTQLVPATVDLLTQRTPSDPPGSVPVMIALAGARVTLTGTANRPISTAAMLRDSNSLTGKPSADVAQHTWEFDISSIPADVQSIVQQCSVTMTSNHQVPSAPTRFEVHVAKDLPPTVEIEGLNADTLTVQPDQLLELPFTAVDDFGIQQVELAVEKGVQEPSLTIIPPAEAADPDIAAATRQRDGSTTLDVAALNVKPGETLSVWLRAGDNRSEPLGGSQSSDSRILTLHVAENAPPVGQQAVQQQHENAHQELSTAIDHLKAALANVKQLSQALTPPNEDPAPQPRQAPDQPDDPANAQLSDKAASEAREQIQSAQQALQRMQDRAGEQPTPVFQLEMEQAKEVSEQELKRAEQQSSLIPLSDAQQQKREATEATSKELEQAIQKLEQIRSDVSQRRSEMELAAQLDELAKQQERLAQRMNADQAEPQPQPPKELPARPDQAPEDQQATSKEQSKDVQQQQEIADALQKLAASDEDARSELFRQRAEEASKLAEDTQRLQKQQERLNQLKDSRDQPTQKRDEQLMEMIAEEQDSLDRQTRELDQARKDRQAADAPQDSQPEDASDDATGNEPKVSKPGDEKNNNEKMEALKKQQERMRDANQAVRENRPEDAAAKLQEQVAERTEQVRQKADELLQRPSDDEENRTAMEVAQEKLQQAAEQTKAASQQPNNQQQKNEPQGEQPREPPKNKQAPPEPAKALEEAKQALQSVCESCQNCAQCKNPGGSSGSGGNAGATGDRGNTENPKNPEGSGDPKTQANALPPTDGPAKESGNGRELAKAAEKASQTAKKPTAEGAKELSHDLNQLADQAAEKSQFPGRKSKGTASKQAAKDGERGGNDEAGRNDRSTPKADANEQPGGTEGQPDGATGNAPSNDQLDSPAQLRGPSTSNWTRSRRMLNSSVLDDRDAKVPQEYRGVVEDYFEQLSRIESRNKNAAARSTKGGPDTDKENEP